MVSLSMKARIRHILRSCGWELRRLQHANVEEEVIKSLLRATQPVAVLDVGANVGQYAHLVRDTGYKGRIVSFEALPQVHAQLLEKAKEDPAWIVAPCGALGSRAGSLEINISANTVSSSLLPMRRTHMEAAPDSVYVGKATVDLRRLDELAPALLPDTGALFVKIDTQGYEKEVLEGATALLPRTTAIQVELSLVPLYEGAPTLNEMIGLLEHLGYDLFGIVPGFKNQETGRLLQVDGFFISKQADTGR